MKKFFAFFMALGVCVTGFSAMAFDAQNNTQRKKAASVKQQEKSGMETITTGSLLPGVIGLVSNVSALNKQQKELAAECVPNATEINWVNNMVKEYAKSGGTSAEKMLAAVKGGGEKCGPNDSYAESLKVTVAAKLEPCTKTFEEAGDQNMIWQGYPKAEYGYYCADGMLTCATSKQKQMTNMYKIFGAIDFTVADYSADEATMYGKIMEKAEKCSPENISKRNKEAYTSFITTTIANGSGTSANTGSIMQAVGGLGSGGLSGLGSLAPTVTQFLDK